ncbi:MAG: hypothetical protein ACYC9I_03065 [Desulfuromonadales bacterium]
MKIQAPYPDRKSAGKNLFSARAAVSSRHWLENLVAPARQTHENQHGNDELRAISRRSLWSLQLFLLISTVAFLVRGFDLFAALPESVLQILGCPPSPTLAHLALAGYIFTVLTPLVIHLLNGEKPEAQWRHLGYRAAFYAFYLFSNTLTANFILVFAVGVILYLLEQVSICFSIAKANQGDGQLA